MPLYRANTIGVVGYAAVTSDQTGISTIADVTSLSVTFSAVPTNYYRIYAYVMTLQNTSAANFHEVWITDGSNVLQNKTVINAPTTGVFYVNTPEVMLTGLSGSVTYKVRAQTSAGTMTSSGSGHGTGNFIVVENLGPI